MIKYTLLENAIDSISYGIKHLEKGEINETKRNYKYSLLFLFQGMELLLKELLVLVNSIIIFDKNSLFKKCVDPLNPNIEELYDCKSIDINEICENIKKHYPAEFDNIAISSIKSLAKERNKLQHFSIEIDKEQLKLKLLQLYGKVIKPAYDIISTKVNSSEINDVLGEKLEEIFCFVQIADNEESVLEINKEDYSRGSCFNCGNYSFFIFYDSDSYPQRFYCTSCEYKRESIPIDEFRECPECGANSLIYDDELESGICLWYKCANHRDGGIPIEMEFCDQCHDYIIEGECLCSSKSTV